MALIVCSECGKEFSDRAAACPPCGCPSDAQAKGAAVQAGEATPKKKKGCLGLILKWTLGFTAFGIVAVIVSEVMTGAQISGCNDGKAEDCQALLDDGPGTVDDDLDEPLLALAGVREFPSRIKCATLAWHTMISATADRDTAPVTTE